MTDMNRYVLYALVAGAVLGALWFYMSPGEETTATTPAEQQQTPGGTTK